MNIHKNLIILGVALTAILAVENIVLNYYAYVFIWYTSAGMLTLISVGVGVLIGFGLKGILTSKTKDSDDNYDF